MSKNTHRHMLLAILFGVLSIGISITLKISAQTTTTTTGGVVCAYVPGEWSDCSSSGIQTRTIAQTPSGCIPDTANIPSSTRSCTYAPPITIAPCNYTYGSWGTCNSSGKQTRVIASRTPSGCIDTAVPILEQTCTYIPTTTNTNTACEYTLSAWSTCTTAGIQTRTILSRTPSGCYDSSIPNLQQTCTYTTTSTTSTTSANNTNSSGSTAYACSYSYGSWSECSSSGKQTRVVVGKTPSGCTESAVPYVERSCTYIPSNNTNSSVVCAYTMSNWSTCGSDGKQTRVVVSRTPSGCADNSIPVLSQFCIKTSADTSTTTNTNSSVTPEFNFLNINGGEVIGETVKIQGTVASAYTVEFYLVSTDSNTPKYLGLAKHNVNNVWEYSFNSALQPNGSYYIRAKVKNAYGSYDGGQRMIVVLNQVADMSVASSENPLTVSPETASDLSATKSGISIDQTNQEWQKKYFKSEICIDQNICGGMADPDKDGLNNNDEYRYRTIPTNPDSDGDGFLDGDEVNRGFDPLKAAPGDKSDKIVFESPKESGEIKSDTYEVDTVELVKDESGEDNLKISGKGIPNSFVTVYIYSNDPIIFTIKTDADGNWSYVLDKSVEEGEHQVYVAVTDNTGKITGKSVALGFVKTAQAVNVIPPAEAASSAKAISPTSRWYQNNLLFFISITLAGLALALASIGLVRHHLAVKKMREIQN